MAKERKIPKFEVLSLNSRNICCINCGEPISLENNHLIVSRDQTRIAVLKKQSNCPECNRQLPIPRNFDSRTAGLDFLRHAHHFATVFLDDYYEIE